MAYSFKPGDIVVFREDGNQIGYRIFITPDEKCAAKMRQYRGEVVKICDHKVDKDGDPCFILRRLDTKGHGIETWTQGYFKLAEK